MTKLVDVQGLKPCPSRGSGSSPDTGSIYFLDIVLLFSPTLVYTCFIYNTHLWVFHWYNGYVVVFNTSPNSVILHISFIFIFIFVAFTLK